MACDYLRRDFLASVDATKKKKFLNRDSNPDYFRSGNAPNDTFSVVHVALAWGFEILCVPHTVPDH